MRRVFLFAALLSLVGLSTAFAASFSTQAEDIDSFSTAVSISVPQNQLRSYYLSGADSVLPGLISQSPPPSSSVNSKSLDPGTLDTQAQIDTGKMHSWQTDPAPAGGLLLSGPATARIFQNGGDDPITAALFICPTAATTATSACARVTADVSGTATMSGEVPISFGNVSATVLAGQRLRLVVVNRGAHKYNLQWGYKTNRESRLDLTVAP
jgi:hypothetical protein